jgi:tetratricopeptide (TPR) repeat protein
MKTSSISLSKKRQNTLTCTTDNTTLRQAYTGAIELLPSYAITYNNIGVLLAKQGRTEEALAHYQVKYNKPCLTIRSHAQRTRPRIERVKA